MGENIQLDMSTCLCWKVNNVLECSAPLCYHIPDSLSSPPCCVTVSLFRYMFWTEWGQTPCIGRARLDGSDQVMLVNSGIAWPNGISIDYEVSAGIWSLRISLFPLRCEPHNGF